MQDDVRENIEWECETHPNENINIVHQNLLIVDEQ